MPVNLISNSSRTLGRVESYDSTKHFYDQNAGSYSAATLSLPMEALTLFAEHLPSGASVVDLGCGAGRDLRAFSRLGFHASGLDASAPLARLAQAYSKCPVVVGDLRALPYASRSFDGAWAAASLLHLRRDDIQTALAETRRILRPGGYLFSSVKCGVGEGLDSKGRWFTYFQPAEWVAQLVHAGLHVVESSDSLQSAGTLERAHSVDWFTCIARRAE